MVTLSTCNSDTSRTLRSRNKGDTTLSKTAHKEGQHEQEDDTNCNSDCESNSSLETVISSESVKQKVSSKHRKAKDGTQVRQPLRHVPTTYKKEDIGSLVAQLNELIANLKTNIEITNLNLDNVGHSAKKVVVDAMRNGLKEMQKQLDAVSMKKEQLLIKVIEATQSVKPTNSKPLYTEILKKTPQEKNPECNVLIQMETEREDTDCVEALKSKLDLPEIGAGVSKVRSLGNKKILLTMPDKTDKEKIENRLKQIEGVRTMGLRAPQLSIILKSIHSHVKLEHIPNLMLRQNDELRKAYTDLEEWEKAIIHKREIQRNGSKTKNVVMKVEAKLYDIIVKQEKVRIAWQNIRVDNYIDITRCFKCQGYGHIAKHCELKEPVMICSYCAEHHLPKDCPVKNEPNKHACHNCIRIPALGTLSSTPHNSLSSHCPVYRHAQRTQLLKVQHYVEYGTN